MKIFSAPQQRKSLPSRGFKTNTKKWLEEKAVRDTQLWKQGNSQLAPYWVVQNKCYDLTQWIDKHPGGSSWLKFTKGQDITQHFIIHHLDQQKSRDILKNYYVKDCPQQISRFSFKQDGFYRTVDAKVRKQFTKAQLNNQTPSKINAAIILTIWLSCVLLTGIFQSYLLAMIAGALLIGVFGIGHNFIHHKENLLCHCIFLASGMTASDYQIMHCLSHHIYPNTELDYQNGSLQPFVYFLRSMPKNSPYAQAAVQFFFTLTQPLNFILKVVIFPLTRQVRPQFIYALPLTMIGFFYALSGSFWSALTLYFTIYLTFGTLFMRVLLCGHRLQQLWSEGSERIQDYGEHTVLATSDTDESYTGLLSLMLFGGFNVHVAHHFFPTVDHSNLRAITDIIQETCKQRGLKYTSISRWQCAKSISKGLRERKPFFFK